MKKIYLLFVLILLVSFQSVAAQSGTCGSNVKYTIEENTISFSKASSGSDAVWGTDCGEVFYDNKNITVVNVIDTIRVDDARRMFYGYGFRYVREMYLSKLDVSNVTDMTEMFAASGYQLGTSGEHLYYTALQILDVSGWKTANVTNMNHMFSDCTHLKSLNMAGWDTSKVMDMAGMFDNCNKLTSLDLNSWNTSNVTDMSSMFLNCSSLTSLDVSNWDTSNVTNMNHMFYSCKFADLDVSSWNTSSVTDMGSMFGVCKQLADLDVSSWNTSNVTDMSAMFIACYSLTSLDVSRWNTYSVTNMSSMFSECTKLADLDVSGWNTSNVTVMAGMFYRCEKLADLDVSGWNTSNVTNMNRMFMYCPFTSVGVSKWDTSKVMYVSEMFRRCYHLTSLNLSSWNTTNLKEMGQMFQECFVLTDLDVSGWDTSKVWSMGSVFSACSSLTSLDLSSWNVSAVQSFKKMFLGCSSLINLDVSNWNPSNVTDMEAMFSNCSSLTSLDVSSWDTSNVTFKGSMFSGCNSLHSITLGRNTLKQQIFQSLPSYNDTWYYAAPGKDAGNPLPIGSAQQDGLLFLSFDFDTMAGTWSADEIFVTPLSQGKYQIIVVDEKGAPLPGAAVTWDDMLGKQTGTTDASGMVFFNAVTYREPVIIAEMDGYITWTNKDLYWEKNSAGWETIILYPESMGSLKLADARYSDSQFMTFSTNLLTGTKKLSLGNDAPAWDLDTGSFYLSCSALDPSAVSSYEIWQGEKSVAQSEDGFFELNSDNFSKGAGCFVRVFGRDGTHMDTGINLVFSKSEINKEDELSFDGSKLSIAVGDNVPCFGGKTWEIDFGKHNIKFPVTFLVSESKLRVGFNVDDLEDPAKKLEKVKEFTEDMKRLKSLKLGKLNGGQTRKYNALIKDKKGFGFLEKEPEFSVLGYAEGDLDSGTVTGTIMIMIKLDAAGLEYNTWCVVLPVTVQVEFSIDGTGGFEISYNLNTHSLDGKISVNVAPKLELSIGPGVSKLAAVVVYGNVELEWKYDLVPPLGTDSLDLTGDVGITAYIGIFTYKRPFAYNTWHLYSRTNQKEADLFGKAYGEPSGEENRNYSPAGIYDTSQYHRADLGYLREEANHMGMSVQKGFTSKAVDGVTAFEPLIENTYRNSRPVMISVNGAAYAAFLRADTSERVYTVVSKNSGSGWAAPVEAGSGDVLADAPALLADSLGRIWLAYARTGSSYDGNTMSSWAKSQELVVGLVDPVTLSFTPYQIYSGMDYVHMHTLTLVNGIPVLVWLSSQVESNNDVLWPVNSTIYTAAYNGSSWSNAAAAGTADRVITELATGEENGALSIGYIMDTDNDYETADDRALVRLISGQTQILSGSAFALTFGILPGSNSSGFIWNQAGTLHSSNGSAAELGIFSSEYKIVENSIYYSASTENGAELCLSRYENGTWSLPIFLTEGNGYLENISAARVSGTDYIMGMYTTPVISKTTVEDSKDLVWAGVTAVSDLVIDGVEFDDSALTAGQTVPVTLTVLNAGDHAVTSADILVNDQYIRTQAVNMDLGESGEIVVDLTIPSELKVFRLKVAETGKNDYRPDDNETEVTLGCPDLTVELEWAHIGEKTQVTAVVRNNGVTPGAGRLYLTDISGAILMEKVFGEIKPGDRAIAFYDLDWSSIEGNQIDVRAFVEGFKEENVIHNNSDIVHMINAVRATAVSIQDSEGSDITGAMITVDSSSCQLNAVAIPESALQSFIWNSSDVSIAEVDESGKVTFKKMGTVTITAVAADGSGKSASVELTYSDLPVCVPGDLTGDGEVAMDDLIIMIHLLLEDPVDHVCSGDLDGDGTVGMSDLVIMIHLLLGDPV